MRLKRINRIIGLVILGWLAISIEFVSPDLQPSPALTSSGTIAYIRGTEIHLIEPDGSNDRTIYTRPDPGVDTSYFFQDLVWRPDSGALAFVSDQENICSWWNEDIFTIKPDGRGLKRITNSPACAELASFKKGTVSVQVNTTSNLVEVYVQGAPKAQFVTASGMVTFKDVADFGSGVVQPAVAILGGTRWYGGVAPDVQPGKTVGAGPVTALLVGAGEDLPGAGQPSWSSDGSKLDYIYGGCGIAYEIPADPKPGSIGKIVAEGQKSGAYPCVVDWGRSANRANQFLYATGVLNDNPGIFLATEGEALPTSPLVPDDILGYDGGQVYDLKWLPDGSGFLFAKKYVSFDLSAIGTWTDIFRYDFATKKVTQLTTQLAHGVDGAIRKLSISPDGQSVVFELDADQNARTGDLYVMGVDGSNPNLLVRNAMSPAWSTGTPQVSQGSQSSQSSQRRLPRLSCGINKPR